MSATFYVTFSSKYRIVPRPVLGFDPRLPDGWYEITADTLDDAYNHAAVRITPAFAFAYETQPPAALYPAGRLGSLDRYPVMVECRNCDGDGTVHARWGEYNYPDDCVEKLEEPCPACGRAGHYLTYTGQA